MTARALTLQPGGGYPFGELPLGEQINNQDGNQRNDGPSHEFIQIDARLGSKGVQAIRDRPPVVGEGKAEIFICCVSAGGVHSIRIIRIGIVEQRQCIEIAPAFSHALPGTEVQTVAIADQAIG